MPRTRARRARRRRRRPGATYRSLRPRVSLNYHKYRLTNVIDLTTDTSSGTVGDLNYWIKNYNLDGCAVKVDGNTVVTGLSDITSLKNLFDVYRVQYIKISYTPRFDKGAYVNEQGALNGMPTCYVSQDPDNENVDQAKTLIVQKQNVRKFDMSRPWTYAWKPKRLSNAGKQAVDVFSKGWINLQQGAQTFPNLGETQIKTDAWSAGTPGTPLNNEKVGELLLEYYVEFKSRR